MGEGGFGFFGEFVAEEDGEGLGEVAADGPTRSAALIVAARHFIEAMERTVGKSPPLQKGSTSMTAKVRPMTASSWRPLDLDSSSQGSEIEAALAESDLSLAAHYDADGNMTILVRSGDATYGRPIPSALPLDSSLARGIAAEDASLAAASMWGLPDFVMRSRAVQKGAASREVGDGTITSPSRVWAVSRTRSSLTCAVQVSRSTTGGGAWWCQSW